MKGKPNTGPVRDHTRISGLTGLCLLFDAATREVVHSRDAVRANTTPAWAAFLVPQSCSNEPKKAPPAHDGAGLTNL